MANDQRTALAVTGRITKGILLGYGADNTISITRTGTAGSGTTLIKGLQQIPDIGGTAETIETTTFNDHAHTFINGLLTYGDSIEFTCLHDATQFQTLSSLSEQYWVVGLPDTGDSAPSNDFAEIGTLAKFRGQVSVRINGVGTNEALTDTIAITPSSSIEFSQASA